jgi:hypothetical protein
MRSLMPAPFRRGAMLHYLKQETVKQEVMEAVEEMKKQGELDADLRGERIPEFDVWKAQNKVKARIWQKVPPKTKQEWEERVKAENEQTPAEEYYELLAA